MTRLKSVLRTIGLYGVIVLGTLVVIDVVLISFGLFTPRSTQGHPEVGWIAAAPTGEIRHQGCVEVATGEEFSFIRNEAGLRSDHSVVELRDSEDDVVIAVTGDSHTALCVPNSRAHFGVLETELRQRSIPAEMFSYGAGMYSPLQAYLAIRPSMKEYGADVLVLNLYTGNDFYDMLRVDDRPHLVPMDEGYRIAPPVWYRYDPPGTVPRSRVLFALRSVADAIGVRQVLLRLRYLRDAAAEQEVGFGRVISYMNDLRRSTAPELGYPAALSAQMLNQQLFFHHFPDARAESVDRVRAFLEMVRQRHPDVLLVLSPLPSYQLVQQGSVDEPLERVWERLPIDHESGLREESQLYERLRELAEETGWVFVDTLRPLREYEGTERLYNDFDYHVLPPASAIIGRAQAEVVAAHLP